MRAALYHHYDVQSRDVIGQCDHLAQHRQFPIHPETHISHIFFRYLASKIRRTYIQTSTSTDNKECLKLAARISINFNSSRL